jgi:hypothetical protein
MACDRSFPPVGPIRGNQQCRREETPFYCIENQSPATFPSSRVSTMNPDLLPTMTSSGSRAIYRLLPTRFPLIFRRVLLEDLYRVRGKTFGPPHKVDLASHIRNGNYDVVCPPPVSSPAQRADAHLLWFVPLTDGRSGGMLGSLGMDRAVVQTLRGG